MLWPKKAMPVMLDEANASGCARMAGLSQLRVELIGMA
jgi:hypothetical protein